MTVRSTLLPLFLFVIVGVAIPPAGLPAALSQLGPAASHLELFGFALVDCGFDDPLDGVQKTDYSHEVAAFSNVAQICPVAVTEDMGPRLARLRDLGMRGLLSIEAVLFDHQPDPTSPSGSRLFLRSDHEARWRLFEAANRHVLNGSFVAAIYLADEPTWNGLRPTEFARAANLMQKSVPGIPTMIVEASPVVGALTLPSSIDWVGFDHYGILDPSSDPAFRAELAVLKSKLTRPEQRIVLVPETQWLPLYASYGVTPALMGDVFLNYAVLALSEPRVIGMICYLWPGGFDDPGQLGARELPVSAQRKIEYVGKFITGK